MGLKKENPSLPHCWWRVPGPSSPPLCSYSKNSYNPLALEFPTRSTLWTSYAPKLSQIICYQLGSHILNLSLLYLLPVCSLLRLHRWISFTPSCPQQWRGLSRQSRVVVQVVHCWNLVVQCSNSLSKYLGMGISKQLDYSKLDSGIYFPFPLCEKMYLWWGT